MFLADPGEAKGCSTNSLVIHKLIQSAFFFPQVYGAAKPKRLESRDSTSSYKISYFIIIKKFLNSEGHHNLFRGLKVMAILLKGCIWPIGGVVSGRVVHE